ncbi:MAG: phosphate ABC transporter permease subunit PstC, partial [Candidatus Deferrimicrobiaceae bacterium]
ILPLFCGTFLTTAIAMATALPVGLISAVYLSEYASSGVRSAVKPTLEMLAAIPTVVYGYFALLFVTPLLRGVFPEIAGFNALAAGLVMGVMIIPTISSLSEDAMHAVPMGLREGALAVGSTRFQMATRVVLPASLSGVAAAFILEISRAVGETMIVAIAAGMQPRFTLNPMEPIQAVTAYIVQVSLGDTPAGTIEYKTIFAAGMSLFLVTFALNVASHLLKRKFREVYD